MLRIGIDVGGTFTDLVAVDQAGRMAHAKSPSTPADQSVGVMAGLGLLAETMGLDREAMLAATERIVHGTTVATNALLERKGAVVGLLTTSGHIDILEMREGLKDDRYDLRQAPPEPLVPRELRLGVIERVRADGRVETPLDQGSLQGAIEILRRREVQSVAIAFLHSWREPLHERLAGEAVRAAMPEAHVCLSSDVLPQIKEYERVCTTVVNAYVGPALGRYLERLRARLLEWGYRGPVLIMQSHGGVATIADAVRLAAGAVLSGPAGGVAGSCRAVRIAAAPNLIPFDMGGTSTDISLVVEGEAAITADRKLAGQRIALSSLDIASIGAGGGSIARVDSGGVLHVGPESAGAEPGPACYGRGGQHATVTDANLVLGFLDPASFLGGRAVLDGAAAERAIDRIAGQLGIGRIAAASGIFRVVNTRMAEGVLLVSVRRGVDPRRFALLSFGGAAGLHITHIARQLEMSRVIVPNLAAVLSAWGMLASDLRYELGQTHIGEAAALSGTAVRALFDAMEREGRMRLDAARFQGEVRVGRTAEMRYGEQIFEIAVPLDGLDLADPGLMQAIAERFHDRHQALYTYALRDQPAVLVNLRVAVTGILPPLATQPPRSAAAPAPPAGQRAIHLDGPRTVPVFGFDSLAAGQVVQGPAIVESSTTTVLLREHDRATTTPHGWLDIAVGPC